MDSQEILKTAHLKMESIFSGVKKDFSRIRTGRASTEMLDHCRVDHYGSEMPINQLATLTIPEPRTIVISPWDHGALQAIERAIQKSDLGLNPVNDGKVIRINLPELSEERRKELVKQAKQCAEEGRVHVRNVRRDANDQLKKLNRDKELSDDELKRLETDVQKTTDSMIAKIDEALKHKEKETLEF
jgi:ribosome recycling factor